MFKYDPPMLHLLFVGSCPMDAQAQRFDRSETWKVLDAIMTFWDSGVTKNKALVLFPLVTLISACQSTSPLGPADCIQSCQTKVTGDKEITGKLAANLNSINASGSAEAQYKNVMEADYGALSDKNCLLVIGLRAIECYKKQGIIDRPTAQRMATDALQAWRDALATGPRTRSMRVREGKVNGSELNRINQSPEADYIKRKLAENRLIRS